MIAWRVSKLRLVLLCFLLVVFFAGPVVVSAHPEPLQEENPASLNGYVIDSLSRETLISATVYLKGTKLGTFTNKAGFFSIKNIPPGTYQVAISYIGYAPKEVELSFAAGEAKKVTLEVSSAAVETEEVEVVAGKREAEKRQITISRVNIPVEQLKQIRIGGEADLFRSLQYLPGILTSSQISSGLYIRGGSPDQNLVLLDGSTVYNPSHLFGFFSTFNTDAIKDVELIKGGYPAEYGGRLSAVLDITQKDGSQSEFSGTGSLGLVSSRLSMEGPLLNGSWFLGGRRTYLDLIANFFPEDPEEPFPDFAFYDINAKIAQAFGANDKLFLSGFMSADDLSLGQPGIEFDMGISNKTGSLRWTHIFGDNLFSVLNFTTSRYTNGFNGSNSGFEFEVENEIDDYTLKGNLEWFTTDALTMKSGFQVTRYTFRYLQNFTGERTTIEEGENETGSTNIKINDYVYSVFGQANYQVNDLLALQAGLRASYLLLGEATTLDPRLALRYQWQPKIAFKLAWGIYHQYLRLASRQDFSFFDTWLPTDSSVVPSDAIHYVAAVETELAEGLDLNVDAYYKSMHNISELNRFNLDATKVSEVFYSGVGHAYGLEVFLQKKTGRLSGWIGYGLGFITAQFDSINFGREFRPKYDRRHDLKIVAQYELSDTWEIGASFTYQTGQSYTGITSRFQSQFPGENIGAGVVIPSQRYGLRLPASHQLNINANYKFDMWGLPARLLIDIYNVYSRRDIWFRFYDTQEEITEVTDVKLLPILPTVALEIKF